MADPILYVGVQPMMVEFEGASVLVTPSTVVRAGHPIMAGRESLFRPLAAYELPQHEIDPLLPLHIADGAAYTGTAAIGDLSPSPAVVIPADTLEVGSRLEFTVVGRYTTTATQGTIILGIYLCASAAAAASANAVAATAAIVPVASQTNRTWRLGGDASVRSVGAAGTVIGALEVSNVTAGGTDAAPATAPSTLTINTTVPLTVRCAVTPSVTTGSWQLHYMGVRFVN